eukprot:1023463-Rhodomonas_salina.2
MSHRYRHGKFSAENAGLRRLVAPYAVSVPRSSSAYRKKATVYCGVQSCCLTSQCTVYATETAVGVNRGRERDRHGLGRYGRGIGGTANGTCGGRSE